MIDLDVVDFFFGVCIASVTVWYWIGRVEGEKKFEYCGER